MEAYRQGEASKTAVTHTLEVAPDAVFSLLFLLVPALPLAGPFCSRGNLQSEESRLGRR
jgi:hypothetical protein